MKSAIVASFGVDVQVHCNAKAELTEVGVEGVDAGTKQWVLKEGCVAGLGCCVVGFGRITTPRLS